MFIFPELFGEGLLTVEHLLASDALDESYRHGHVIDVLAEVEDMGLQCSCRAVEGGSGADIGHGRQPFACITDFHLHGIDAVGRDEEPFGSLEVGRRESHLATFLKASHHSAREHERAPEASFGHLYLTAVEEGAYYGGADLDTADFEGMGLDDFDAEVAPILYVVVEAFSAVVPKSVATPDGDGGQR